MKRIFSDKLFAPTMRIDLSTMDIAAFVTAYFTAANSACSDSLSSASSYFSQFDIKDASLHKLEF